jgi:L-asparaginase
VTTDVWLGRQTRIWRRTNAWEDSARPKQGAASGSFGDFEGGGKTLVEAGAIMGDDLSPQKARILLMLLLQNGTIGQDLEAAFNR